MKRVFGMFEAVFDLLYLLAGAVVAMLLFMGDASPQRMLAGLMAVVLVASDSFHLVPREPVSLPGRGMPAFRLRAEANRLPLSL